MENENKKQGSLLSVLFFSLINLSPVIKRKLWKHWYNLLARKDDDLLLASMNYGYMDNSEKPMQTPSIKPQLALYDHVLAQVPVVNKTIVEVGAGRGGGATHISDKYQPALYLGIDIAYEASVNSVATGGWNRLHFITGDALSLPIQPGTADIVINVESSHCYGDLEQFIKQVSMILSDDGYFCYCDLMPLNRLILLQKYFLENRMEILEARNITPNVMLSLDHCTEEHSDKILNNVPWYLRKAFADFVGIKDTGVYNLFKTGKYEYFSFLVKKKK